ncbi:MAG: hypothetical protein R3B09_09350 [Nannocystaceae bacterium]
MRRPRRLAEPLLFALAIALTACGSKSSSDDGATQSGTDGSAGTTDATASTTAGTGATGATDATTEPVDPNACPPDLDLCRDYCLNLQAKESTCLRADVTCFDWCFQGLDGPLPNECADEARAAILCQVGAEAFDGTFACESSECAAEYLAEDVCRGWCGNLSGVPFSGSTLSECEWGSLCGYAGGHTVEMTCSVGDAPSCACLIDEVEVGTCALGFPIKAIECGGEDFHVLKGCCNQYFLPVLDSGPARSCHEGPTAPPLVDPSGTSCPLRGMYVPCVAGGTEGQAFCDVIDGAQVFGPCLADPVCRLAESVSCDMHCELIAGVPTWVPDVCDTSTSG